MSNTAERGGHSKGDVHANPAVRSHPCQAVRRGLRGLHGGPGGLARRRPGLGRRARAGWPTGSYLLEMVRTDGSAPARTVTLTCGPDGARTPRGCGLRPAPPCRRPGGGRSREPGGVHAGVRAGPRHRHRDVAGAAVPLRRDPSEPVRGDTRHRRRPLRFLIRRSVECFSVRLSGESLFRSVARGILGYGGSLGPDNPSGRRRGFAGGFAPADSGSLDIRIPGRKGPRGSGLSP